MPNPSFVVKTKETMANDIMRRFLRAFNEEATPTGRDTITDINKGSIYRTLVESICEEFGWDPDNVSALNVYQALINVYNSGFIDYAVGYALDNVVAILDVTRKPAVQSQGTITFLRNTVPASDFTIPVATSVTTEPTATSDAIEFTTSSSAAWEKDITDEEVTYDASNAETYLAQKFIDSLTQVQGTKQQIMDYNGAQLVSPTVPHKAYWVSTTDLVDDDAATPAPTPPATIISISAEFTSSQYNYISNSNDIRTTIDGISNPNYYTYMLFEFDITDFTQSIADVNKIIPYFEGYGSADSNDGFKCFIWNKDTSQWDNFGETTTAGGSGSEEPITNLSIANTKLEAAQYIDTGDKIYLLIESGSADAATPTQPSLSCDFVFIKVSEEDFIFTQSVDYVLRDSSQSVEGYDCIYWGEDATPVGYTPEDNTSIFVTYTPLSLDVTIQAVDGGDEGNVGVNKIIVIKSSLPNIDSCNNYTGTVGGGNEETDEALRDRAKNSLQALGKATSNAIKYAVLSVDGVRDTYIQDTPNVTVTNEEHTYTTGDTETSLNHDWIQSVSNVEGTVSGGSYTFVVDVDYELSGDGKNITWISGGVKPDNSTIVYYNYVYLQKGVAIALVLGTTIPMSAAVLAEVETIIDETKAAGIIITVAEPTYESINVSATVYLEVGAVWLTVKAAVEDSIEEYITALGLGDDVIYTELVYAAQNVEGVYDVTISTPSGNVSIASDKIAAPGIIVLTQG